MKGGSTCPGGLTVLAQACRLVLCVGVLVPEP